MTPLVLDLNKDGVPEILFVAGGNLVAVRGSDCSEIWSKSAGLGNPADKLVFGLLRQYPDALLVGAGTVRVEGYNAVRLTEERRAWRRARGLDPYPRLIVISRRLDLDPTHRAFTEAPRRPVILTSRTAPPDRVTALSAVNWSRSVRMVAKRYKLEASRFSALFLPPASSSAGWRTVWRKSARPASQTCMARSATWRARTG